MLLTDIYAKSAICEQMDEVLTHDGARLHMGRLPGSMQAVLAAAMARATPNVGN